MKNKKKTSLNSSRFALLDQRKFLNLFYIYVTQNTGREYDWEKRKAENSEKISGEVVTSTNDAASVIHFLRLFLISEAWLTHDSEVFSWF